MRNNFPPANGGAIGSDQVRMIKKYGLVLLGLAVFLPYEAMVLVLLLVGAVSIIWYMVADFQRNF